MVAVSPVVKVSDSDGWVTYPLVPVRTFEPRVEVSDPSVSARRVYAELAERVGMGSEGRFVQAEAVRILQSSFTVDCPGSTTTPVYGSVTPYGGSAGASLQCGVDPAKEGGDEAWMKEAYELTCGRI
ncbi:hypothetical protein ACQEWB_17260 [Streptomyces sp. CA-249302]|uniref:hypothetical protein n=1 Tax=Streptomyces sp. CA-249302 TaxID=3240058 RepID=UPI003D8C037E